jgi:hypothetical protein
MTIRLFIVLNLLVNLLQAAFTQLIGDEALYWMYSQNPALGYRDHPPMIGWLISIGDYLHHSELGVRLLAVVINALSIYVLYNLIQPQKWWQFALPIMVLPALNLYAFIATPDAPLIFFTVLFLFVLREFIRDPSLRNQLLLGLIMALLLWSKYHGFLVILLCIVPLYQIWTKKSWWVAVVFGIVLYSPHLYWQISNDLPTIKFHIVKRAGEFEWKHLWGYIGGQLLVLNPVLLIMFIIALKRNRTDSRFQTSIKWLALGMPLLFLFSSLRGRVEPHWTVTSSVAMFLFVMYSLDVFRFKKRWFIALGFFATVFLFVRICLVFDIIPGLQREFHTNKQKMEQIHQLAGEMPVCFMNSYQNPSLYRFYTGRISHSINTTDGGENQYDFWHFNDQMHLKKFFNVSSHERDEFEKIKLPMGRDLYYRIDSTLAFLSHLDIIVEQWHIKASPGSTCSMKARLKNNNHYSLRFSDPANRIQWQMWFNHKKEDAFKADVTFDNLPDYMNSGETCDIILQFQIPHNFSSMVKGGLAASVNGLPFTYQSNWIRLEPETENSR